MIGRDYGLGGPRTLRWVALASVAALAGAGFALLLLGLSGWLITASALTGVGVLAALEIFAPGAGIRAAAVGRTVARYLERLIGHEATFRALARLRRHAFGRLLTLSVERLDAPGKGDTLNRLTRDVDALNAWLPSVWLPTVAGVGATLIAMIWLFFAQPLLLLPIAVAAMLAGALVLLPGARAASGPGRRLAETTPAMREEIGRWLDGLGELVSLDRAAESARRIEDLSAREIEARKRHRRVEAWMHGGLMVLGYLGFWSLLVLALLLHQSGLLSAPIVIAGALIALALVEVWLPLAASVSMQVSLRIAARRVRAITDPASPDDVPERAEAGNDPTAQISAHPIPEARALRFSFHPADPPLLDGVDLALARGEHVLITGPSGCGKTTLARLLAGVLMPSDGQVLFDGNPVERIDTQRLHACIGWLPQRVTLFNDTLAANLRVADPAADDARLRQVLQQLALDDLLDSLPGGLDGWVGEHGRAVSGGEARRIALARLVLADFPVLVLDEPTAGLDVQTAARVFSNLSDWLEPRTLLICAHDTGTLPRIDRCFRLQDARLQDARLQPQLPPD